MWWITSWSRELGRGKIKGTQADELEFDGAIAMVDDFRLGEEVHVELERQANNWRVVKIWSDNPRFELKTPVTKSAPQLIEAKCQKAQSVLSLINLQYLYNVISLQKGKLILKGDERVSYPPPSDKIVFIGVSYFDLALRIRIKSIRLSTSSERDFLFQRVDSLSSNDISVSIIDKSNRFFFVVCQNIKYFPVFS